MYIILTGAGARVGVLKIKDVGLVIDGVAGERRELKTVRAHLERSEYRGAFSTTLAEKGAQFLRTIDSS